MTWVKYGKDDLINLDTTTDIHIVKMGKGTPTYSDAIEWTRKEVINKACELLKSVGILTDDGSIMGFIKAMEE